MNIEWNITKKGRLKGCSGAETRNLVIPDGVKEIDEGAFRWHKWIKSVVIPEGVSRIGAEAFAECRGLKEIIIPKSVRFIGQNAFFGTPWLEEFPDDFVVVNHVLIHYKGSAEEITIPETVKTIGECVFFNASAGQVQSMRLKIKHNSGVSVRSITFSEGLKEIECDAFAGNENLTELYFPESLKYIGSSAFKGCASLERIRFPSGIDGIGFDAFSECPLLKRVPVFVSGKNVFFSFQDTAGYYYKSHFVDYRDYENMDILSPEVRHDLMFQIYAYHMDEHSAEKYIRKHFPEMIPVLIRLNDEALFRQLTGQFPNLMNYYIDAMILEANRQQNHELQIQLMHYRYQHEDCRQKDLYL